MSSEESNTPNYDSSFEISTSDSEINYSDSDSILPFPL